MKKVVIWLAIIAATISLVIINQSNSQSTSEPIVIGAIYPITGNLAIYGVEYRRGLELAAKEININGGINGHPIKLIIEDDGSDVTRSVSAANKLINANKVHYLFTAVSAQTQATAPIAEKNKVLYMSVVGAPMATGTYIFRDYWKFEDQGKAIGLSLKKEGLKKLGVLTMQFSDVPYFQKGLKSTATGTEIVIQKFNFGDSHFQSQLLKLKSSGIDALLVYAFPGAELAEINKEIVELGMDNLRLYGGCTSYEIPSVYKSFSSTMIKMKTVETWYSLGSDNKTTQKFLSAYRTEYKSDLLVGDAAYPYDDLYALKAAISMSSANPSTLEVAQNLKRVKIDGAAGPLTFDKEGSSERAAYLQTYTSSGWKKYNYK